MKAARQRSTSVSRFTPDELLPSTGSHLERQDAATLAGLAKKLNTFSSIYIQTPAHKQVFRAFDQLRLLGLATAGERQFGIRNLAPTGSGKTRVATEYRRYVESLAKHREGDLPVVVVQLDRACTTRRLWSSILDVVGDEYSERGTEEILRKRAYGYFKRLNVELLIIDEVQHLEFRSSDRNDVTDALKRVLDDGVVPIALIGTDDASNLLQRNRQLTMRLVEPCDIKPLGSDDGRERAEFKGFVLRLDAALVELNLTRMASNLDDRRTLACLFEMSGGVIGRVVILLRVAFMISFRRDADYIEVHDLSAACKRWAVAQGAITHDPFSA